MVTASGVTPNTGEVTKPRKGLHFLVVVDGKEYELDMDRATAVMSANLLNPEIAILELRAAVPMEAALAILKIKAGR